MKKQAEEWLIFAYYDLLTIAEIIDNKLLTTTVAFHAQQCIEKSFKALLALHDHKIPRIHDLRKLLNTVPKKNNYLKADAELLDQLNQVYIDTRYPADFGLLPDGRPSLIKVREFYLLAENIYHQVEVAVKKIDA